MNPATVWAPRDYAERVYAGVLGKIIGVYLGRPFEGWTFDRLIERFGEVRHYVHEALGVPLIVADDDISGTFTFLRALEDNGFDAGLASEAIGKNWLNYIVEDRTVLWWGGMGTSTEHTAFLRLKSGMAAPDSGSIAQNGRTVAEQIGAQIFIDGWGLICPGDPERAASFAERAGKVSHDGEAVYAAQVVAAMVALAFIEPDIDKLLDAAVRFIPSDSTIYRLISDVREWHASGLDWRTGFRSIEAAYGYRRFGGGCHVVPNHALIIHALLHGRGEFSESLAIVNTCGWDTDCNSGNVGCILGVRNGLPSLQRGGDWRGPVRDQILIPTADGGRCVTDAVQVADRVIRTAHGWHASSYAPPKDGAPFHFSFPGSVQGFRAGRGELANVEHEGRRMLQLFPVEGVPCLATTPTFLWPELLSAGGYGIAASPTLYSGQVVRAAVTAPESNGRTVHVTPILRIYGLDDEMSSVRLEPAEVGPGKSATLEWTVPTTDGFPIAEVGLECDAPLLVDSLRWDGAPAVRMGPTKSGSAWRKAWVDAVDHFESESGGEPFRLIQNRGTGMLIHGCRDWRQYSVESRIDFHLCERAGIALHVQGLRRWMALLLLRAGQVQLVKCLDSEEVVAEFPFAWEFGESHMLKLSADGSRYRASIDGEWVCDYTDDRDPIQSGAVGFLITEGRIGSQGVAVSPI